MKCKYCNNEINDDVKYCPYCGSQILKDNIEKGFSYSDFSNEIQEKNKRIELTGQNKTLGTVAKVFMILSCIVMGIYIFPLLWTIPMTISLSRKLKNNESISVGFKICTFLFCNTLSGILLLCMNQESDVNN